MTKKKSNSGVIEAAGGIIWRESSRGRELALIHRPRYGDWTLPKGKRKRSETWQETALREVKEETGCEVCLGDFAGSISYQVDGDPKVVLFWNMCLVGECEPRPSDELDELLWLPARKAVKKMDYEGERALIKSEIKTIAWIRNFISKLQSRLPFWLRWISVSHQRLAASISTYRTEINHIYATVEGNIESNLPWRKAISALLDRAEVANEDGRVDAGWRSFHAAQRMELLGLAEVDQVNFRNRAQSILNEGVQKLSSWRKKTVEDMLTDKGSLKRNLNPSAAYYAALILHEHYGNVYQRLNILRRQQGTLLFISVLSLLIAIEFVLPVLGNGLEVHNKALLLATVLFGCMGASISGTLSLARESSNKKIPDQILSSWVTLARPVVGAVAALAIFTFVLSGLFQIGDVNLGLVLAVAFASGFSERLLVRAVEAV